MSDLSDDDLVRRLRQGFGRYSSDFFANELDAAADRIEQLGAAHQRGREAAAKAVEDKAEELRLVADRHRATGREDVAYRLGFTASHLFALRDAIRSLKTNAIAQRAAEGGGEQNETTAALDNPESNHTANQAIADARREMG